MNNEKPLTDEEWCAKEASKYDPQHEVFAACRLQDGLAEGRRREREEAFTDAKALQIILEREEAAACLTLVNHHLALAWPKSRIIGRSAKVREARSDRQEEFCKRIRH